MQFRERRHIFVISDEITVARIKKYSSPHNIFFNLCLVDLEYLKQLCKNNLSLILKFTPLGCIDDICCPLPDFRN